MPGKRAEMSEPGSRISSAEIAAIGATRRASRSSVRISTSRKSRASALPRGADRAPAPAAHRRSYRRKRRFTSWWIAPKGRPRHPTPTAGRLRPMARYFNTAGPCRPGRHYMLPADRRLPGVRRLIEQEAYFVVHAPRQSGKTTALRTLAEALTAEGRYAAVLTTCETGQSLEPDLEGSVAAILDTLRQKASEQLPPELHPPEADPERPARTRLLDFL